MREMYIITGTYQGRHIERIAASNFQAFTIIGRLSYDGVVDLGMREESRDGEKQCESAYKA